MARSLGRLCLFPLQEVGQSQERAVGLELQDLPPATGAAVQIALCVKVQAVRPVGPGRPLGAFSGIGVVAHDPAVGDIGEEEAPARPRPGLPWFRRRVQQPVQIPNSFRPLFHLPPYRGISMSKFAEAYRFFALFHKSRSHSPHPGIGDLNEISRLQFGWRDHRTGDDGLASPQVIAEFG